MKNKPRTIDTMAATHTAETPVTLPVAATPEPKAKRVMKPRKPAEPRKIFGVVQVLGEDGQPMKMDKANVRLISFEKDAEEVLAKIDSGEYPNALYLRGTLPAGR